MRNDGRIDDVEVKKANIRHHDVEAGFFEHAHPEGSSVYERSKVLKSIAFIAKNSVTRDLCVDVGCGTGFVTSFEVPLYRTVIAIDISSRMIEVARKRLSDFDSLNLMVCDAELLPFKNEVADFVSVSSVLHHLLRPFNSMMEICRILKQDGFLYVTREPNSQRLRRFFNFFDQIIIREFAKVMRRPQVFESEVSELNVKVEGLDYSKVDVNYPTGFHVGQLVEFLCSKHFEVISAYSYHWIYPDSNRGLLQKLLTKSNFLVEKMPFSNKLGRYVSVIARKLGNT